MNKKWKIYVVAKIFEPKKCSKKFWPDPPPPRMGQ